MKAIILCAGKGTRLRPITHTLPKHIIPIANKPILFYIIEKIANLGIKEIGIIVGDNKESIRNVVKHRQDFGAKIFYIEQREPKGLANAVKMAQDFVQKQPFLVFLGDNILEDDLTNLMDKYNNDKPNSIVLLTEVDEPQRYGIAVLDGDRIVKVVEKPKVSSSNLAIAGVYIFDRNIFTAIDQLKPSWRGEYEITDAIQYLVENTYKVEAEILKGKWLDTGEPADILDANRFILENSTELEINGSIDKRSSIDGKVWIGKGTKVKNSIIKGPVSIGNNCCIEDSFIGSFTSIGDNSKIFNIQVYHSIILENSIISNIGLVHSSLIGRSVIIEKDDKMPAGFRFIIGDNAKVRA